MLFKPYHIPMIRSGSKTVTRREWAENYSRPNEGSVQIASDEMFKSDEEADCYIRILDVYDQALGEMSDEDAQMEGDYESLEEFKEGYAKVYGDDAWDPEKEVAVVEFEYVGRERPRDNAQLATDGGASENEAHQIWAGGTRDLQEKLSERYGVDELWLKGDHYDEEADEHVYDALVYFDGDEEHLIADDVPVFGHGPSGAAGVYKDTLPSEEEVMEVVNGAD